MTPSNHDTSGMTARALGLLACALAIVGCQGQVSPALAGGDGVEVQPPTASTVPSGAVTFAAVVSGAISSAVTWSVVGSGSGTIDTTGLYRAPGTVGTFQVVATSVADPTKSGAAVVDVNANVVDTSILPADRRTLWNPGLNAVGGIPSRATIYTTLSPRGGTQDDTAAIQAALDACPANQVVKLNAGTFRISGDGLVMNRSNVTLRGAGPTATTLSRVDSVDYATLIMGERWYNWGDPRAFTADGAKGATSVTVASATGLRVGEIVHVNETYDSAKTWFNTNFGDQGLGDYQGWGEGRAGPVGSSRPIGQAMEIAAISGNTVTFSTPFHIAFRTSKAAHLTRIRNGGGTVISDCKWNGLEDLKVQNGRGGDGGGNIRVFAPTAYSWIRNVESYNSTGASAAFDGTFRCELRGSYLHHSTNPSPGGEGYGIVIDAYAADNLVEDNISFDFNKVIAMRSSGGGNVIGYNYMEDGYGAGYKTLQEVGLNAAHMATPHHELFEGNQSWSMDSDSRWGNSIYVTFFRNHVTGLRRNVVGGLSDDNARVGGVTYGHWWYSFIGNVLGSPTTVAGKAYEHVGTDANTDTPLSMWRIGYNGDGVGPHGGTTAPEVQSVATTLRDGNWDWLTQSQRWHGIGGAVGAGTPVTIPPSLYLANKPAFLGAAAWPLVDPSTGAVGTLPARARFDASH